MLEGLIAATFTPVRPDGSFEPEAVPRLVEHLLGWDVRGLYVLGSTGEGASFSTDERFAVAEAFVEAVSGRVPVIIQVGHDSPAESRRLAAHAQQIKADAVSAVVPTYFKPQSVSDLVAWMSHVAAGAPELPFYYYHIPILTGLPYRASEVLAAAARSVPNLAGLKFTAPQLDDYLSCLNQGDKHEALFGLDEMMLPAMAVGSKASVGSTFNFAAPIYTRLRRAFDEGNLAEARLWQSRAVKLIETFVSTGARNAQKAIMTMIDQDCGPPRLPQTPLSEKDFQGLRVRLEQIGFFQWIKT